VWELGAREEEALRMSHAYRMKGERGLLIKTIRPYRTVAVTGPHLEAVRAPGVSLFTFGTGSLP